MAVSLALRFSEVQMLHLKAAFAILDKDSDGTISAEDLHRTYTSLGEDVTLEECREYIEQSRCLLLPGLTFPEFVAFISSGVRHRLATDLPWRESLEAGGIDVGENNVEAKELFDIISRGEPILTLTDFKASCGTYGLDKLFDQSGLTTEQTFAKLSGGSETINFSQFSLLLTSTS